MLLIWEQYIPDAPPPPSPLLWTPPTDGWGQGSTMDPVCSCSHQSLMSGLQCLELKLYKNHGKINKSTIYTKIGQDPAWMRYRSQTSHAVTPCPLSWMLVHAESISFATVQSSHNSEIYNIGVHAQWFHVNRQSWQRSVSGELSPIAHWKLMVVFIAPCH